MPQCENINIFCLFGGPGVDININTGDIIYTFSRAKTNKHGTCFPVLGNHVSQELLFSRE